MSKKSKPHERTNFEVNVETLKVGDITQGDILVIDDFVFYPDEYLESMDSKRLLKFTDCSDMREFVDSYPYQDIKQIREDHYNYLCSLSDSCLIIYIGEKSCSIVANHFEYRIERRSLEKVVKALTGCEIIIA